MHKAERQRLKATKNKGWSVHDTSNVPCIALKRNIRMKNSIFHGEVNFCAPHVATDAQNQECGQGIEYSHHLTKKLTQYVERE